MAIYLRYGDALEVLPVAREHVAYNAIGGVVVLSTGFMIATTHILHYFRSKQVDIHGRAVDLEIDTWTNRSRTGNNNSSSS